VPRTLAAAMPRRRGFRLFSKERRIPTVGMIGGDDGWKPSLLGVIRSNAVFISFAVL
jgi:hypothetical protein